MIVKCRMMRMNDIIRYITVFIFFVFNSFFSWGQVIEQPIPNNPEEVYSLPLVPNRCQTVQARAEYVLSHYWDGYNFSPISVQKFQSVSEQCLVNYLDLLSHFPDFAKQSILNFLAKLRSHNLVVYRFYMNLLESYLYDPSSPMHNESLYIPFLQDFTKDSKVTKLEKQRYVFQLEVAMRNQPGCKATNFIYTLMDGTQHALYDLKGKYTLLYINNPDCKNCQNVKRIFMQKAFSSLFKNGKVTLLSLFPDPELDIWEKALKNNYFPNYWIVAYDQESYISENNLYDLRRMPTMYLLDKNKKVILKDASISEIESYLRLKSII